MRRPWFVVGLAVALALAIVTAASAGLAPEPVQTGGAEQFRPSSNGTYLAWSQFKSRRNDVYVRPLDDPTAISRVNRTRTEGILGSFIQGSDEIVYQQFHRRRSDLWMYDATTHARDQLPGRINTADWEWWPAASSEWVLFLRDVFNARGAYVRTDMLLGHLPGGGTKILMRDINFSRKLVAPGYAGDAYVAWTVCARTCNVFYRNVDTNTTSKLPIPANRAQYAPFLDETDGTIYFVRSGNHCGQAVSIRRASLAAPGTSVGLTDLPRHIDTDWMMSVTENPVSTNEDLYFGRYSCTRDDTDVYVLRDADTFTGQVRERPGSAGRSWRASVRPGGSRGGSTAR